MSDDLSLGGSKKASKRLYSFRILKRVAVTSDSILRMYNLTIRPILEYGVLVWPVDIPEFLSRKLESIQKRALHHYPSLGYDNELSCTKLSSLVDWRVQLCRHYIFKISQNRNPIHCLAPKDDTRTVSRYNLRTASTRKVVNGDRSSAAYNAQVLL